MTGPAYLVGCGQAPEHARGTPCAVSLCWRGDGAGALVLVQAFTIAAGVSTQRCAEETNCTKPWFDLYLA